jgi:hypothetical protein
MILFNAASAVAYWEPLLVQPSEQRRVAGRERPSEQRSEGQPGFLEESRVHLHRHPAPITATQLTDTRLTDLPATHSRATDTQAPRDTSSTPVLRVMDIRATRETPLTPVPLGYGYPGYSGQPAYPSAGYGSPSNSGYPYSGPSASAPPSDSGQPAYPGAPGYGFQSTPPYSPYSGSGYRNPVAGYSGDRPSEDWSPGAEYAIEPAS